MPSRVHNYRGRGELWTLVAMDDIGEAHADDRENRSCDSTRRLCSYIFHWILTGLINENHNLMENTILLLKDIAMLVKSEKMHVL